MKNPKILLVGGGSGGHVTPLKAVADQLLKIQPTVKLTVVTDKTFYDKTRQIFADPDVKSIKIKPIFAGKLRRYHTKPLWWHFIDLPTLLANLRDIIYLILGFWQSLILLIFNRPKAVFCKGGYVSVPVGLAAYVLRVPIIIHDSDAHPGITNRLLSKLAKKIATGMPTEYYPYPADKTVYIGMPSAVELKPISKTKQREYKEQLGFETDLPLILVTGGSQGAAKINQLIAATADQLLGTWQIAHLAGQGNAKELEMERTKLSKDLAKKWQIKEFVKITPYILAADLIISRTGASAMQDFANAKKAVITIPGKQLAGNHQVKNAKLFSDQAAVVVLDEDDLADQPAILVKTVKQLADEDRRQALADKLFEGFAKPAAARQLAEIILQYC